LKYCQSKNLHAENKTHYSSDKVNWKMKPAEKEFHYCDKQLITRLVDLNRGYFNPL